MSATALHRRFVSLQQAMNELCAEPEARHLRPLARSRAIKDSRRRVSLVLHVASWALCPVGTCRETQ